jgi:glycosyltransferase involved in cell wall biosynthesis
MSKCWIDLTDLSHWKGHMTGIQRVVYNLAEHYHKNDTAAFFMFDPKIGFYEVSFESVLPKVDAQVKAKPSKRIARRVVRGLYVRNAHFVKRSVKFAYRNSPSKLQQVTKQKYIEFKHRQEPMIIASVQHPFQKGDVVLLAGASWHKASIIMNLGVLKESLGLKIVHVVYDMIPEISPQFFGQGFGDVYIKHMFNVFSISDHLLAISENTKRDSEAFQDRMLLPKAEVSVFRLGDNPTHSAVTESPDDRIEAGNYVLAVGTLEIRKNYLMLYYVWKKAALLGKKLPKLVIVGQPGWLSSDSMYLMQFDPVTRDSIIVLSNASDSQVAWLYKNSKFSVYPSWYEGWGLPIAESLNYGKFCISSNTSSMTEIAGNLIEYFDPFDTLGCLELIEKYSNNPELLTKAEHRIEKEYKKVSWSRSYEDCSKVTQRFL